MKTVEEMINTVANADNDNIVIDAMRVSSPSKFVEFTISFLWKCGAVIIGLTSIAVGVLYYKQDALLYFPTVGGNVPRRTRSNPRRYRSPGEHSIPFEEHFISCSDGVKIHAWLLFSKQSNNAQRASRPTVLFFHGNAGNIGLRLPIAIHMVEYLQVNVLMVEYRGYGDSDDVRQLNEAGLKLDAEASLHFTLNHAVLRSTPIFIYGQSLGGAVAFHLAQYAQQKNIPLAGLLIENTFLSISHMVDQLMPFLSAIKTWVLRIGWSSFKIAPTLHVPVLYLAGKKDELVPHSHMKELHKLSMKRSLLSRMHIVQDGMHNDTFLKGGARYWEEMQQFIKEAIGVMNNAKGRPTSTVAGGSAVVSSAPLSSSASLYHRGSSTVQTPESVRADSRTNSVASLAGESIELSASSIAVKLGTDGSAAPEDGTRQTSLPVMPANFIGLAREAAASSIRSSKKDSREGTTTKKHN